MKTALLLTTVALAAAGCASYSGRGLEPGKSTESDVTRVMGAPTETLARANGDKVLFYSRQPEGRATYAATVSPDGSLRSLEQVLQPQNIRRIVAGIPESQVRELLGPPARSGRTAFKPFDIWEYRWQVGEDRRVLWVAFADGVAQEVTEMHDFEFEPNTGRGKD